MISDLQYPTLTEQKMVPLLEKIFTKRKLDVTIAAFTLKAAEHEEMVIVMDRAAGVSITLPAASGSFNRYYFYVKTTFSGGNGVIKVANASDTMVGFVETTTTTGATTNGFAEAAGGTDDTITMNGTTTGGVAGSWIECMDILPNVWKVNGLIIGSGVLVTSLSATV